MYSKPPYSLWTEINDGVMRFLVSFMDGQGIIQTTEVDFKVYDTLNDCKKDDLRQWRSDRRHIDRSAAADIKYKAVNVDNANIAVINIQFNECYRQALLTLPEKQRNRFILHYEFGLTYEKIAAKEGVKKSSVAESVEKAKEKIWAAIKYF